MCNLILFFGAGHGIRTHPYLIEATEFIQKGIPLLCCSALILRRAFSFFYALLLCIGCALL